MKYVTNVEKNNQFINVFCVSKRDFAMTVNNIMGKN